MQYNTAVRDTVHAFHKRITQIKEMLVYSAHLKLVKYPRKNIF
jgi:hypothetical protein